MLPSASHGVPLQDDHRGKARKSGSSAGASSSSGLSSTLSKDRMTLPDVTPLDAEDIVLPEHLRGEAHLLQSKARSDNPITESQTRPLVKSCAIWLMLRGTINLEDSPGVIQKVGDLLHDIIPLHLLQKRPGGVPAIDFAGKIVGFLRNHVTSSKRDLTLQVPHDASLNTPMRALEHQGLLQRLDEGHEPVQGHSGNSIIGKGRRRYDLDAKPLALEPSPAAKSESDEQDKKRDDDARSDIPHLNPQDTARLVAALAQQQGLDIKVQSAGRSGSHPPDPPRSWGPPRSCRPTCRIKAQTPCGQGLCRSCPRCSRSCPRCSRSCPRFCSRWKAQSASREGSVQA